MAYSAPSTRSTSDLITAAIWNADVVANPIAIYAGAMSVSSQAVGDILYASSTTQLGRVGIGTANKVLTSTGSAPQWVTQIANAALPTNIDVGGTLDVTGDTTLDGELKVSGAGPHGIGFAPVDYVRLAIAGNYTSGGASTVLFGLWHASALTGHADDSAGISAMRLDCSTVTAGNATLVSQLNVNEPQITVGSGTVTNSASVYVAGAATEATNNFALWVDAGATQLDGTLDVAGVTTLDSTVAITGSATDPEPILHVTRNNVVDSRAVLELDRNVATNGKAFGILFTGGTSTSVTAGAIYGEILISQVDVTNGAHDGSMLFATAKDGTAATKMALTNDGHLGIGETAPNNLLHITTGTAGAITAIRLQHDNSSTNDAVSIDANMTSDITTSGQIMFKRVATNAATEISFWTTTSTGGLTQRAVIDRDGQVGIGTASPDCPLGIAYNDSRLLTLDRLSTSASDIGIQFRGGTGSSANAQAVYGEFDCYQADVTNGSIDAYFRWSLASNQSLSEKMVLDNAGNLTADGTKSFRISHPVASLNDSTHLIYYATEGPRADLLYRGSVDLVAGTATVDVDAVSIQTDGTFVALTRDPQIWVHNATGWDAVRGSLSGNTLTITCQDATSTDTIHWLIVADRYDAHMQTNMVTDPTTGRPVVEYEKVERGRNTSPSASISPSESASPSE